MSDFIDLGPVTFIPVVREQSTENCYTFDDIYDGIRNTLDKLSGPEYNIIAVDESIVHFLSDFTRNIENFDYNISILNNYKRTQISGSFNPYIPTLILHSGVGLDVEQMNLRMFYNVRYMKSTPIYITLLKTEKSDYHILNVVGHSCSGYGFDSQDISERSEYDLYVN